MKISSSKEKDCLVLSLSGEISFNESSLFQEQVDQILHTLSESTMVVDFSEVSYISSAGLRILLKLGQDISKQDKKLIICGLNKFVISVFEVSGFNKIFNIKADVKTALAESSS